MQIAVASQVGTDQSSFVSARHAAERSADPDEDRTEADAQTSDRSAC
jgi:hypothetical protein